MSALTKEYLESLGVEFPDDASYASFIDHYHSTVYQRTVDRIVAELDDQQIIELDHFKDQGDKELNSWLIANVPEFGDIVKEEVYSLIGEIVDKRVVSQETD